MAFDPYINPDAKWRKAAKSHRRRRGFPWYVLIALVALVVLGGGFLWYVLNPPAPEAQLSGVVPDFQSAWDRMDSKTLFREWFVGDYTKSAKLIKLLGRKGWTTSRPALELVTLEVSPTKTGGRTDFKAAGLPPDALVKVYWLKRHGHWRVTNFKLIRVPDAGE